MKKYISIATLLAAGIAFANAAEEKPITLPGQDDFTWIAGSNASGIGMGASAEIIQNLAAAITASNVGNTDLTGWFGGTGQAYDANAYGADISIISSTSFSFKCRPALSGEYVAFGVELTEEAESITLSFSNTNKLGYSLWSYDTLSKTATELIGLTYQGTAGTVTATYDTDNVEASQIFAVWTANPTGNGNAGGGAGITVSDIALSYTPYTPVPEPSAFGLLAGLGALALVGARRRRK